MAFNYAMDIYIPANFRWITLFLHEFHASPIGGHVEFLKTYHGLAANLYWVGIKKDVERFVATYAVCQRSKSETLAGLLNPLPLPKAT